ncbi:MAG: hypothetical protein HOQ24_06160, partial [Mycobacteriaceae bacterium]|nr:hypothetical protein [Mycobacteriaceae bacterium]
GAVGALAAAASLQFALLVNALTFVVSLACLVGTRPAARPRPAAGETTAADLSRSLLDGFRYLGSTRPLLVLTVLQMIVNFGLASEKLLVFFATETLSMSPSAVGVIVSAGGLGGIAGALTAARIARRFRPTAVVAAGIAVASGAAVAMGGAGSFAALFVANLVYLWAVVVASLVNRTVRQLLTRRDMLGRATGTGRLLFRSVDPLGVLAMGGLTVAMHGDPRAAFVAGGLLACLATAVAWFGYFSTNCREY